MGKGFAPGKVLILGEHSVVFGRPALAAALSFGITAEAEPANSGGIQLAGNGIPEDVRVRQATALIGQRVGVEHARVRLQSDLSPGGGLGSSAAFAVALIRALAGPSLSVEKLCEIALESEHLFHGKPSGVDHTIIALGGVLRYWKGPPPRAEKITPARSLNVVVGLTGRMRNTGSHVLSLAKRAADDPHQYEPLIDRLGELALGGASDVESGHLESLGERMNEAHDLLDRCGVSSAELDDIVATARKAGALGAKLTGAGGGGAALALVTDPEPVLRAIRARGFEARAAVIGES